MLFEIIIIITLFFILYLLLRHISKLNRKIKDLEFKIRSQNVKHGKNWENFVPFMNEFNKVANKDNFVFIGHPIDGISFDDDSIKFIEIKTGQSRLNDKQKAVKELIKNKKIKWFELRF